MALGSSLLQRPPALLRPGVDAGARQRRHHRLPARGPPPDRTAGPSLAARPATTSAAPAPQPRRHRRHRGDGHRRCCPALRRAGVHLRFRPSLRHPAVRKLVTLSGWTLGYVLANQVALIVVKNLAKPGSGGQDAYSKAFTFFQLPHGLLAVSITTTFVPDLARFVARKDKAGASSPAPRSASGWSAFFTFPASIGLLVLAGPIVGAFLQHGQFTRAGRGHHRPGARRLLPRAGRLLGLPVRAAGLLRPPGHPHAVRHQLRRERAQHRARGRSSSAATGCRACGLPSPSPTSLRRRHGRCRCVAQGARLRRLRPSWPAWAGCCWPPGVMAVAVWVVMAAVGANAGPTPCWRPSWWSSWSAWRR